MNQLSLPKNKSAYLLLPYFFNNREQVLFKQNFIECYAFNNKYLNLDNHISLLFKKEDTNRYSEFKNLLISRNDFELTFSPLSTTDMFLFKGGETYQFYRDIFMKGEYHNFPAPFKQRIIDFNNINNITNQRILETLFLDRQHNIRNELEKKLDVKISIHQNCVSSPYKEDETFNIDQSMLFSILNDDILETKEIAN